MPVPMVFAFVLFILVLFIFVFFTWVLLAMVLAIDMLFGQGIIGIPKVVIDAF